MGEGRIERVGHVGVTVSDLDRALAFYRDLLGFELLWERVYEEPYIVRIVGVPEASGIRVGFLRAPGGLGLELLEYLGGERGPGGPPPSHVGTGHFCLLVEGIHELWERIHAAGVGARSDGPVRVDAGPNEGGFSLYLLDPDGYHVELHQPPPR